MKYVDPQYWSDENGIGVVGEFRKNIISVLEDEDHFMDAEFNRVRKKLRSIS